MENTNKTKFPFKTYDSLFQAQNAGKRKKFQRMHVPFSHLLYVVARAWII